MARAEGGPAALGDVAGEVPERPQDGPPVRILTGDYGPRGPSAHPATSESSPALPGRALVFGPVSSGSTSTRLTWDQVGTTRLARDEDRQIRGVVRHIPAAGIPYYEAELVGRHRLTSPGTVPRLGHQQRSGHPLGDVGVFGPTQSLGAYRSEDDAVAGVEDALQITQTPPRPEVERTAARWVRFGRWPSTHDLDLLLDAPDYTAIEAQVADLDRLRAPGTCPRESWATRTIPVTDLPVDPALLDQAVNHARGLPLDLHLSPWPRGYSVGAWVPPPYTTAEICWRPTLHIRFFRGGVPLDEVTREVFPAQEA